MSNNVQNDAPRVYFMCQKAISLLISYYPYHKKGITEWLYFIYH